MRHAAPVLHRDFRCRYLNALIDLNGVAVHNLAAEAQRQRDSQFTFTGSCGTNDSDDEWSADILSAFFNRVVEFDRFAHPREMISRIAITIQMSTSRTIPATI